MTATRPTTSRTNAAASATVRIKVRFDMMFCSLKSVAKVQQPPKKRFPLLEKYLPYFENSLYQYVTRAIFGIKKLQWTAQKLPTGGRIQGEILLFVFRRMAIFGGRHGVVSTKKLPAVAEEVVVFLAPVLLATGVVTVVDYIQLGILEQTHCVVFADRADCKLKLTTVSTGGKYFRSSTIKD